MKKYSDYSLEELSKLQKIYSEKDFLNVEETGIWLQIHPNTVRKCLRSGEIVGAKLFGSKYWRINVRRTKAKIGLT